MYDYTRSLRYFQANLAMLRMQNRQIMAHVRFLARSLQ